MVKKRMVMNMAMFRIGIATSDGIVVNQHFGRASRFLIVDVDENGELHKVEDRMLTPVCEGGNHDDDKLSESVKRLSDCNCVLVSRIGAGASGMLEAQGTDAYEIPGMIEDSVHKLLAYMKVKNLF